MGFGGFSNPFKKAKNVFSSAKDFAKKIGGGIGDAAKSVGKGVGEFGDWLDVTQPGGFGDLITMGSVSQYAATKEAKKAREQAQARYKNQIQAARAEAERIANLEDERKRKLLLYGTQNPSTMIGGYLGLGGSANVSRPRLG